MNRPTPCGLSGQWRHTSEWICLAAQAGLTVPRYVQSSRGWSGVPDLPDRTTGAGAVAKAFIIVDRTVVGPPAPPSILAKCRLLAKLSKTALLGVKFAAAPDGYWTFAGATTHPDLRTGGEEVLDALARVLTRGLT